MQLLLFESGKKVNQYPIAVGQARYPTPKGNYEIGRIEWNPWWIPPDSDWAKDAEKTPPGPGNPLGPVKMVMDDALRIHGTNSPKSIGRAASHGCIRMHSNDAKTVAWHIQSRSSVKNDEKLLEKYTKNRKTTYYVQLDYAVPVEFIYEPVVVSTETIEIYPDIYGKIKKLKDKILEQALQANLKPEMFDEAKLAKLKKPAKKTIIPLRDLLPDPLPSTTRASNS